MLSLPGASATLILENVVLRGSPSESNWMRNGGYHIKQGLLIDIVCIITNHLIQVSGKVDRVLPSPSTSNASFSRARPIHLENWEMPKEHCAHLRCDVGYWYRRMLGVGLAH